MTNQQRRKLQGLIRAHVTAQIRLSWVGSGDITEQKHAEEEAQRAKSKMNNYLSLLVS